MDALQAVSGIFIPCAVLIWIAIGTAGAASTALALLLPAAGMPLGVGVGVTGLLHAFYTGLSEPLQRSRSRPGPTARDAHPPGTPSRAGSGLPRAAPGPAAQRPRPRPASAFGHHLPKSCGEAAARL